MKTRFTESDFQKKGFAETEKGQFAKAATTSPLYVSKSGAKAVMESPAADPVLKPKRSKYGNHKVEYNGIKFDSKKERDRWIELNANHARYLYLERQKSFDLVVNDQLICRYVCDFYYYDLDNSEWTCEDVKSPATRKKRDYRIKFKLMRAIHFITILET